MTRWLWLVLMLLFIGCRTVPAARTADFEDVMRRLARSWSVQDTEAAVACFTPDAIYTEPPDVQLYRGHAQLRRYFGALKPGTFMRFHNLWFDERSQMGAGEFSFGREGKDTADVGIAVVRMERGRIAKWREYHRKGPADFDRFISTENKTFRWHIGNYP